MPPKFPNEPPAAVTSVDGGAGLRLVNSDRLPARVRVVFFGILLGATLSGLDASIIATAAPTLIADLGDLTLLPWLTTSYLIAQVATMAVFGKLGDIHGRKKVFAVSIGIFLVASVLCGVSTTMPMLIAFRVLQGIGAGGITGLAMALVADLIPRDRLGRYLGYTGLVFALTSVIGPFVGGVFVDQLSWRWAFFVNVPSGALCLLAIIWQPRQAALVAHRIDVRGALLLGVSVTSLLVVLSEEGAEIRWTSPVTLVGIALFVVGATGFILWERRAPEPLLPLRILGNRVSALATSANLLAGVGFTSGVIYPPIFFQAVAGVNAQNSGLLLAPFALVCALATLVAGQFTDRFGGYKLLPLIGMVLLLIGYGLLGTIDAITPAWQVALYGCVGGAGVGLVMQTLLFVVQRFSTVADMGVATSTVMLARVLGSSLGVAVLGSVFTSSLLEQVSRRLPGFPISEVQGDPQRVAALDPVVRIEVQEAFAAALAGAFRIAVPIMFVGLLVVVALPARRIREVLSRHDPPTPLEDQVAHIP